MLRPTELPAGFRGAAVGRLHDAGSTSRADDEALGTGAEGHGPFGDAAREFARFFVVARHLDDRAGRADFHPPLGRLSSPGSLLHLLELGHRLAARLDARRAEHHDRVSHIGPPEPDQRIEIFGQDAQRTSSEAVHELGIFVGQLRHGQVMRTRHSFPPRKYKRTILSWMGGTRANARSSKATHCSYG